MHNGEFVIISTSRPYFAPFPGFFHQAQQCDVFVILDSIQFPRGTTWITRNRFKNDQGTLWMTIPVWKKGLGLQSIDEVKIYRQDRQSRKHLSSLKQAYAHAPYFYEHLQFLEQLFLTGFDRLIDFNMAIIGHLMLYLGIDSEIKRLSRLNIKSGGDRLILELCRYFNASTYLAPAAAVRHLNAGLFRKAGIEIRPGNYRSCLYPQLWGNFLPDLSTFDLLFNCGPKAREILFSG